jgi:hypothetical protein
MFRKSQHPAGAALAEQGRFTDPSVPSRSCCCPAQPVVMVLIPPRGDRTDAADLWLCGHHYRASRGALLAAGAIVLDLTLKETSPQLPEEAPSPA